MKGKIILFSSVLLLLVFAVAPLMASANACYVYPASVPVASIALTSWPTPLDGFLAPTTPTVSTPTPYLTITRNLAFAVLFTLTIDGKTYDKSLSLNIATEVVNTKTGVTILDAHPAIWYPGTFSVPFSAANGFKGIVDITTFVPPSVTSTAESYSVVYTVFQGFGTFHGQTLILDARYLLSAESTAEWTGVDIMP